MRLRPDVSARVAIRRAVDAYPYADDLPPEKVAHMVASRQRDFGAMHKASSHGLWVVACVFALCAAATPLAPAQTSPASAPGPAAQFGPGGIGYLSGGAGEEERAAMLARQAEFPFKLVLSGSGGEYRVADRLSVVAPQGKLLAIGNAGPVVMMKLPPGQYTFEVTWQGKTERRSVRVAAAAQTLDWRLPG